MKGVGKKTFQKFLTFNRYQVCHRDFPRIPDMILDFSRLVGRCRETPVTLSDSCHLFNNFNIFGFNNTSTVFDMTSTRVRQLSK